MYRLGLWGGNEAWREGAPEWVVLGRRDRSELPLPPCPGVSPLLLLGLQPRSRSSSVPRSANILMFDLGLPRLQNYEK
jgi:hypothetical protein